MSTDPVVSGSTSQPAEKEEEVTTSDEQAEDSHGTSDDSPEPVAGQSQWGIGTPAPKQSFDFSRFDKICVSDQETYPLSPDEAAEEQHLEAERRLLLKVLSEATTPEQAMRSLLQFTDYQVDDMPPEVIIETLSAAEIPITDHNIGRAARVVHEFASTSQREPNPMPMLMPAPAPSPSRLGRDRAPASEAQGNKDNNCTEADAGQDDAKSVKSEPCTGRDWSFDEVDTSR